MNYTVQFNFCKYVSKQCFGKSPSYYMAMYNSTDCFYMKEPTDNVTLYTPIYQTNGTRGLLMTLYDARETNITTLVTLVCQRGVANLTLLWKNYNPLNQTFMLGYGAEGVCPGEIYNVIWTNLGSLSWLFLIIGLVVGPLELLLGYKVFRITIFIVR